MNNVNASNRVGGALAPAWQFFWFNTSANPSIPITQTAGVNPVSVSNEVQFCDIPHFLDDQRREHAFGDAVRDSTINDPDSTEFIYYDKEEFYKQAKQDSTILYLGTANDMKYQQAFDSLSQTNIGKYESVKEHLVNNQRLLAIQQLTLIVDENLKEQNLKYISSLIAIDYSPYLDTDSDTIAVVNYIANQHPFYGGEAVYMARAILHIDVVDQFPAMRRAHIQQTNPPSFVHYKGTLFPNPTNDKVTLSYAHDEKTDVLFTVKSAIGSQLSSYKVIGNELVFSTSFLNQGMYFITVYENGIEKETHRLAVIR